MTDHAPDINRWLSRTEELEEALDDAIKEIQNIINWRLQGSGGIHHLQQKVATWQKILKG